MMISISGVMFLFGLTWLFAILTFSVTGLREIFQILFVVFNSFQGFAIFLFFCVFNKEALESWKVLLSCGKCQSKLVHSSQVKLLHSPQAKFSASAAAKKPKQTNTGSIGFSSSSGGNYASEMLKSDYESANLTKGLVYENTSTESKADLKTDPVTHTFKETSEPVVTQTADLKSGAAAPVVAADQTESTDGDWHQTGSTTAREKEGKKKKKTTPLKVRIRRYSTKRIRKNHVEEAEVDFYTDNSSSEGSDHDKEDAATQV